MYQLSQTLQTAIAAGNPQRVLIEFTDYNPVVQFSNEDIAVDAGLHLSETFTSETDLTIGQCLSAEISFTLLNNAYQLENFEFGTFTAYLGARIDTGTPALTAKTKTFTERGQTVLYEFAPLGVFVMDRPDVTRNMEISVSANDRMTLFDKEIPSTLPTPPETAGADPGTLTYPTTLADLFVSLCYYVGVPYKSSTFLNSTLAVSKKPKQFSGATMRDVLSWIAEAACSNARFNRDGELELFWLNTVNLTFDEGDYEGYTQSWYETQAIDGLHIRNADSTSEYTVGTGTNAYLIQDNPFLRQSD